MSATTTSTVTVEERGDAYNWTYYAVHDPRHDDRTAVYRVSHGPAKTVDLFGSTGWVTVVDRASQHPAAEDAVRFCHHLLHG